VGSEAIEHKQKRQLWRAVIPWLCRIITQNPLLLNFPLQQQKRLKDLAALEYAMISNYRFSSYTGKVTLFNALNLEKNAIKKTQLEQRAFKKLNLIARNQPAKGWKNIAHNLYEIKINADSASIMQNENLKNIARYIGKELKNNF